MARPPIDLSQYDLVKDRIPLFWAQFPEGAIRTEVVSHTSDMKSVMIRAALYADRAESQPVATGIAMEQAGVNGFANTYSWVENCETSAIGRALANLNMTLGDQRPSHEEMRRVQRMEEESQVRAPEGRENRQQIQQRSQQRSQQNPPSVRNPEEPATQPQKGAIMAIGDNLGMERREIDALIRGNYGEDGIGALTRGNASDLIQYLQAEQRSRRAEEEN